MQGLRKENNALKVEIGVLTRTKDKFKNQLIKISGGLEAQKAEADKKLRTERRNGFEAYCRARGINLERQIENLTGERNTLLQQNKDLEQRRNEFEKLTISLTEENEELKATTLKVQNRMMKLRGELNERTRQKEEVEKKRLELEDLLSSSMRQCEELEGRVQTLEQTLQNEKQRFETEIKNSAHKHKVENENASSQIKHLESVLEISNQHNERLNKELTDLKQIHMDLQEKSEKNLQELNIYKSGADMRHKELLFVPGDWEEMADNINCKMFPATPDQYQMVERRFFETLGQYQAKIIKIDRIQNKCLYLQYKLKKSQIKNHSKSSREELLWHGTFGEAVSGITVNGFDRGFQGLNGTMYGKGVYFSTASGYSVSYSRDDRHKEKHMFLARVLTGDSTVGKSNYTVLPIKDFSSFTRYDSLVNAPGSSPSIYVVMNDSQAYPEYLVTYEITGQNP